MKIFIFKASIITLLLFSLFGCVLFRTNNNGIVKIKSKSPFISTYTHKYQRGTFKALPILITTGLTKKDSTKYCEIEFRVPYKRRPMNFNFIELENNVGYKWTWSINRGMKHYIKKSNNYNMETYSVRIDHQVDELSEFFYEQPIKLTFRNEFNQNIKVLKNNHIESLINVLKHTSYNLF